MQLTDKHVKQVQQSRFPLTRLSAGHGFEIKNCCCYSRKTRRRRVHPTTITVRFRRGALIVV